MTTSELKSLIVENILNINDDEFLEEIYEVLSEKKDSNEIIKLENWQKERIEESIKQFERGEHKTSDVVFKEIEEWLQKK